MTNKMWGGRFSKATNELLEDLNASIKYDYRLAKYDIEVSIAHIMMLAKSGVIQKEECNLIVDGLKKVQKEVNLPLTYKLHAGMRINKKDPF